MMKKNPLWRARNACTQYLLVWRNFIMSSCLGYSEQKKIVEYFCFFVILRIELFS